MHGAQTAKSTRVHLLVTRWYYLITLSCFLYSVWPTPLNDNEVINGFINPSAEILCIK